MAGAERQRTPSAMSRRRAEEDARARRDRLILYAIAGVLAAAALIVGAGLFVTQYLPPRAHVLTIGDDEYNAAELSRRAQYFAIFEGGFGQDAASLVDNTINWMLDNELVLQHAPALVGEVTDEDIDAELRERLGFAPPETEGGEPPAAPTAEGPDDGDGEATASPEATSEGASAEATETAAAEGTETPDAAATETPAADETPDADETPAADETPDAEETPGADETPAIEATETPTPPATPSPAPTVDEQAYGEALANLLSNTYLERDEYYDVVRAQILRERLREHFGEELGDTAPQVQLRRIRVTLESLANDLREQALEGADFAALAAEHSQPGAGTGEGGVLEWQVVSLLEDEVADAIEDLEAGEVTEVVDRGTAFELYQLVERDESRELDEESREALAAERVETWIDGLAMPEVERDVSEDEREWIVDRVVDAVTELTGQGA